MFTFLLGAFVGAAVGLLVAACLNIERREEDYDASRKDNEVHR